MTERKELNLIEAVSIICAQQGCTLESIDGRTINIHCPGGKEQEIKCANAVQQFMEGTSPSVEVYDTPEGEPEDDGCCGGNNPSCNCGGECKH